MQQRGRRWKVSTRHKSLKHFDQDSLAEARIGRLQSASSRSAPCHLNLVYAVLSLAVHTISARIKVRPQSNLDGSTVRCLLGLPQCHAFYDAAEAPATANIAHDNTAMPQSN
jgi:hypothetical protein